MLGFEGFERALLLHFGPSVQAGGTTQGYSLKTQQHQKTEMIRHILSQVMLCSLPVPPAPRKFLHLLLGTVKPQQEMAHQPFSPTTALTAYNPS